ncbi:hypothetical protein SCCGRSA3_01050 [Marine Group I thaumarchaeote SCGC RSA3]|uniref:Uncharacterized protein n=1 Tax=Marine Group I thaumarchaeote SCGC RSA3 TaxID=1503183 RepID=A0A087RZ08_9ARCH|nr:hypothetical protein SCCGRSA3_01050 [Marine Group I thaumarchaeote SCGC RSA3]
MRITIIAAYAGLVKGINPIMKSKRPTIKIISLRSNFNKTRPQRIDKNMPELRAISLLHIKVITLTLPHCSAIVIVSNLIIR